MNWWMADPRIWRRFKVDNIDYDELYRALEESLKLQAHYAELLNMHDGGQRIIFKSVNDWIARLRQTK